MALVYAGLGDNAEAIRYLGQAMDDRSNPCIFLHVDPEFDNLRNDPRFIALLQRLG